VDQALFMRDIRRNFPTVLRTLDSCFVPLAARSDVVLTASSEPCPPSTIPLRTLLLRQCCVARRSPGSQPLPGGLNPTRFSLLLLFPAPDPENKVFLNVSLFNRVFLHVGQVGHQQYDNLLPFCF
ncbi:hypothetical protein ILYODFUR_012135, partial [Ilyodon furcidens]